MESSRQPCFTDVTDRYKVILHFRDLANIGPMLQIDLDKALTTFRHKLIDAGWSSEELSKLEAIAYSRTIYENQIPRPIRNLGNRFEYMSQRGRKK